MAKVSLDVNEKTNKEYLSIKGVDTNNLVYDYLKSTKINGEVLKSIPLKESEQKDDSVYKFQLGF